MTVYCFSAGHLLSSLPQRSWQSRSRFRWTSLAVFRRLQGDCGNDATAERPAATGEARRFRWPQKYFCLRKTRFLAIIQSWNLTIWCDAARCVSGSSRFSVTRLSARLQISGAVCQNYLRNHHR